MMMVSRRMVYSPQGRDGLMRQFPFQESHSALLFFNPIIFGVLSTHDGPGYVLTTEHHNR